MNEKPSEILFDRKAISLRVAELGAQITRDMRGLTPCIAPVMDGAMIFAADLVREIRLDLTLQPIKASSYGAAKKSSGNVRLPWGIPEAAVGKDILLLDDILDTGRTLVVLKTQLLEAGANSVKTCVLLRKEPARTLHADYVGFEIPDMFVVGYGLDDAGLHRNLPYIGVI